MFGWRRLKLPRSSSDQVPSWGAGVLEAPGCRAFEAHLEAALKRFGLRGRLEEDGRLILRGRGIPSESVQYVHNAVRAFGNADPNERDEFVDAWLRAYVSLSRDESDNEFVLDQLRPVLVPEGFGQGRLAGAPLRQDLPGLETRLVLDSPIAMRYVVSKDRSRTDLTDEALYERAHENLLAEPGLEVHRTGDLGPGGGATTYFLDGNAYVSSRALLLDHHADLVGPAGAVVAVPAREAMIVLPIDCTDALAIIGGFAKYAADAAESLPHPISPLGYYWDGERFAGIVEVDFEQGSLTPPDDMVKAVERAGISWPGKPDADPPDGDLV